MRRWSDRLRRYVIALAALVVGCGVAAVLLHTVGDKARIVISLMGDLLFLGAAWLGYGEDRCRPVGRRLLTRRTLSSVDGGGPNSGGRSAAQR